MTTALAKKTDFEVIEQVLVTGNLGALSAEQRVLYYNELCKTLGLNPLTKPFEYIILNGKLVLYVLRSGTDQLRKVNHVSITIQAREVVGEGAYVVTARAVLPDGREDEAIGAVPLAGLKGEAYANALMKAETKAKRRVTLSICGLGMLDESEVAAIPGASAYTPPGPHPVPERPPKLPPLPPPAPPREDPPLDTPPTPREDPPPDGEERPRPPRGFHYVSNYVHKANGFHEFDLLDYDAEGGAIHCSTKKKIGFVAREAAKDGTPVHVVTEPKPGAAPGEFYVASIEKCPPSLAPFAGDPPPEDPSRCPICGLDTGECPGHDPTDGEIPF